MSYHRCIYSISAFPEEYNKDLYKAHTEDLYKGLLVHLDDPSSLMQVLSIQL